ncbi:uncharacterized protein PSFLO_02986 [Pseudozyma flocculosa]|uniref:Uncharacterized protein n=1 Tax=Pseudozyma flocculosa TaxID=84751 RepID=A0A5C3F2H6_9BASI|nr:uncharacterized protein PSFLO_02986 [Pseudozyma flocculosa]
MSGAPRYVAVRYSATRRRDRRRRGRRMGVAFVGPNRLAAGRVTTPAGSMEQARRHPPEAGFGAVPDALVLAAACLLASCLLACVLHLARPSDLAFMRRGDSTACLPAPACRPDLVGRTKERTAWLACCPPRPLCCRRPGPRRRCPINPARPCPGLSRPPLISLLACLAACLASAVDVAAARRCVRATKGTHHLETALPACVRSPWLASGDADRAKTLALPSLCLRAIRSTQPSC